MPEEPTDYDYKELLRNEGLNRFDTARSRAFWREMINLLRGKSAELLSFEDIRTRLRLRQESYKGLQEVPLDKIVGSVGRYRDFTRDFLPKKNEMKDRWSRVYAEASGFQGLPPIELYKIGDAYFVRDGNHRVSVARQLGAKTIEAHVTELPTRVEFTPGMSQEEIDLAAAYAAFLEETGLDETRPHHVSIRLSEPSRYNDLLGHVYLHQRIMELQEGREVLLKEAAANWYDSVYRPAITLIRKHHIMENIDDRTEGDLYLWLVDHLREVREKYGEEAKTRKFSDALVDFLHQHGLPIPRDLFTERDDAVSITDTQAMEMLKDEGDDDEN